MDDLVQHSSSIRIIRSNDLDRGRPLSEVFSIEVFAGSGRLTAAMKALGLKNSFGIDHKLPQHLRSPIIQYDLMKPDQLSIVQNLIQSPFCAYVHFAPPCGTSSRARLIQRRGRWNPPILRTDEHPNGIPNLSGVLAARVASANLLYQVTCDLVELCLDTKKYFSVENPGRSFMWLTSPFARLTQKHAFREVYFHHCKYGSSRRKLTKFLHNVPSFQELELFCTNDHPHEPWGQSPAGHWHTAEETSYPWELCRAMAAKLVKQLQADGYMCTPPVFALQEASLQTLRATTDIQPRRGLQLMVAEFKNVIQHPAFARMFSKTQHSSPGAMRECNLRSAGRNQSGTNCFSWTALHPRGVRGGSGQDWTSNQNPFAVSGGH